ncbi:MAG: DUF4258 domain-containing protein [Solirubrobacteraceae bacterium]
MLLFGGCQIDPSRGIQYDSHAELQMRRRGVSRWQVEWVLRNYHTSHPTEPLRHTAYRSMIYIGTIAGRELKVYAREGSDPVYVTTVAWRDE